MKSTVAAHRTPVFHFSERYFSICSNFPAVEKGVMKNFSSWWTRTFASPPMSVTPWSTWPLWSKISLLISQFTPLATDRHQNSSAHALRKCTCNTQNTSLPSKPVGSVSASPDIFRLLNFFLSQTSKHFPDHACGTHFHFRMTKIQTWTKNCTIKAQTFNYLAGHPILIARSRVNSLCTEKCVSPLLLPFMSLTLLWGKQSKTFYASRQGLWHTGKERSP